MKLQKQKEAQELRQRTEDSSITFQLHALADALALVSEYWPS